MKSGADLCWGRRRLDSSLPKSDSLAYIHALCLCVCVCVFLCDRLGETVCLKLIDVFRVRKVVN